MDKKMRLSFLFFFIIFICASFSVVAANDAKVIYDIVERDEAVDVTIKIKGEVTKLTAFTSVSYTHLGLLPRFYYLGI